MFFSLLADYAFDAAEPVVLWLTVAVVAALIVAGIILFFVKREITGKYVKYGVLGFVAYALIMGILMLTLQLVKRTSAEYLEEGYLNSDVINYVLVPLLVLFVAVLICGAVLFVLSKKNYAHFKTVAIVLGSLCFAGVIAAGATIGIYFSQHIIGSGYYDEYVDQVALYASAVVLAVVAVVGAILLGLKDKRGFDSRSIALAGVCIAMSFVLSYVKLWRMPQAGSVTFVSMLPVMLYAYIYGTKKGVLVGFIYGLMQAMQDPWIIHPAQFLLDYPIAYAMVGFAGAFSSIKALKFPQVKFALGAILAGSLRFLSHVLAGVYAFGADAISKGFGASVGDFWLYSLGYNSYIFVDVALVIVAGVLILSAKTFVKQIENYSGIKKGEKPAAAVSTSDELQNVDNNGEGEN
ncbi:MAG: energy-coupled thiamine transporter ThiT [Clostridia bacterium]|nr:energy-coupled thiamine transporter ThiT [Clostridia bacterium]